VIRLESCSSKPSITISDVIEYLYCPRFTYFMHCLSIPQREEKHFKVRKGREIHLVKEKTNIGYLRKRYNVIDKLLEVYMSSPKLGVRGIVDEVLFFDDGTAGPLDYKFAEYRNRMFRTHRYQSALYGLMIAESFNIPVERGYIVYTRSKNKIIELEYTDTDKTQASKIVENIFNIIQIGEYPEVNTNKRKCLNCTYRRICTQ
jgi:CRISPR-associated exonuclease Cas4